MCVVVVNVNDDSDTYITTTLPTYTTTHQQVKKKDQSGNYPGITVRLVYVLGVIMSIVN